MSKTPLITVLIVTHNRPNFLEKAVDSVFAQTLTDYEIVIVGNQLTETNKKHLVEISKRSDAIRIFFLDTKAGSAASRNLGVNNARGDYIAFLDDDDIWLPNKLEKQLFEFERYPEAGLVYSYAYLLEQGKDKVFVPDYESKDTFQELLEKCFIYSTSLAMVRRSAFDLPATIPGRYLEKKE